MTNSPRGRRRGLSRTVYQRGSKRVCVVDINPDPPTGKRQQHWQGGFETETAAWDALADLNADLHKSTFARPVNLTVSQFLTRWLDTIKMRIEWSAGSSARPSNSS